MNERKERIETLDEAIQYFRGALSAHPERDGVSISNKIMDGKRREHSGLSIGHLAVPGDAADLSNEVALPEVVAPGDERGKLAREIIGMLEPLKLLNPVSAGFSLGEGPGTLVTCFGIPLNPETENCPAYTKKIDDVVAEAPPDVETSGLMPAMRRRIELIRANTPLDFKITMPDMQGPFNLAHAMVGEEAMLAPLTQPGKFHRLMQCITDFWIAARRALIGWIGEDRLDPWNRRPKICECSVNLVSPDFYKEFVLPHDLRICEAFGPVHVHPCSGPHVFRVTLDNLPSVVIAEAGFVAKTAAGSILVDEALAAIGDREIVLQIGQELPEGHEYEFIRTDLDRYEKNPRISFNYTGMHWRKKDRGLIRDIHRRLDEYWAENYSRSVNEKPIPHPHR